MKNRAFTLIELLVVISIIGLLSSIVLASLNSARAKGALGAGKQFEASIFHAEADQAIGIYDFGDCAGTTVADRSGAGYNIPLTGSPAWSTDTPSGTGCSLSLNGSSQYGSLATTAFDKVNGQEITVSAWIKPGRLGGQYQDIVGDRAASGALNWLLYQHATDGSVQFHGSSQNKSTYIPPLNVWTHIAAVVDAGGTSKLYANGALVQTVSGYTFNSVQGVLALGAIPNGTEPYLGLVDDVRIFSKSLTASDVRAIYAAGAFAHKLADLK